MTEWRCAACNAVRKFGVNWLATILGAGAVGLATWLVAKRSSRAQLAAVLTPIAGVASNAIADAVVPECPNCRRAMHRV